MRPGWGFSVCLSPAYYFVEKSSFGNLHKKQWRYLIEMAELYEKKWIDM